VNALPELGALAIGGTAVGTGLNADPRYPKLTPRARRSTCRRGSARIGPSLSAPSARPQEGRVATLSVVLASGSGGRPAKRSLWAQLDERFTPFLAVELAVMNDMSHSASERVSRRGSDARAIHGAARGCRAQVFQSRRVGATPVRRQEPPRRTFRGRAHLLRPDGTPGATT
jgi:hypothetical protein